MSISSTDVENPGCLGLRQVRTATGLSQEEFAAHLGFSRPYVQAVETGQRPSTVEFAHRVMLMFGATRESIFPGLPTALDLEGNRYTSESYRRHRQFIPRPVTEQEIGETIFPLLELMRLAGSLDKTRLTSTLVNAAFRDIRDQLGMLAVSPTHSATTGAKLTVGSLRANPALAVAVGFVDDGTWSDERTIVLDAAGRAQNPFPILEVGNVLETAALAIQKRLTSDKGVSKTSKRG